MFLTTLHMYIVALNLHQEWAEYLKTELCVPSPATDSLHTMILGCEDPHPGQQVTTAVNLNAAISLWCWL